MTLPRSNDVWGGLFYDPSVIQELNRLLIAPMLPHQITKHLEKPENKGAGVRPHPCFRGSFGRWFIFREVLIMT
jgi:hypothetical protein